MTRRCELCGRNRWRTVIKNVAWICRECGNPRPDYDRLPVTEPTPKEG